MKLGRLALVILFVSGCTISTSQFAPVGRSSTTGGVVCPSGYEPSRSGSCVMTPNKANDQDAFR
jgi:hypothetical protein